MVPIGRVVAAALRLDPPVWNHIVTAANATGVGVANAPAFQKNFDNGAGSVGLFQKTFAAGARNDVFTETHLLGSYYEGSDIHLHLHMIPLNNNGGNVIWQVEYLFMNEGGANGNTTLLPNITQSNAGTNDHKHLQFDLAMISGFGKTIDSFFICRVSRLGNDVADTYTGEIALLGVGLMVQFDTVGSELMDQKYK